VLTSQSLYIEASLQLNRYSLTIQSGSLTVDSTARLFVDGSLSYNSSAALDMTGIYVYQTGSLSILGNTFFGKEQAAITFDNPRDDCVMSKIGFLSDIIVIGADSTVSRSFQFGNVLVDESACLTVNTDLYTSGIYGYIGGTIVFNAPHRIVSVASNGRTFIVNYSDGTGSMLHGEVVSYDTGKVTYRSLSGRLVIGVGGRILDLHGNIICDKPGTYTMTPSGWHSADASYSFRCE